MPWSRTRPYEIPDGWKPRARIDPNPDLNGWSDPDLPASAREPMIDRVKAIYSEEVAYTDHHLGRFFERLKTLDIYDRSVIIVTSDHGVGFFEEHGHVYQGSTLYDELIHTPLLVRFPNGRLGGTRVPTWVSSLDALPTAFKQIGVSIPKDGAGADLQRVIETGERLGPITSAFRGGRAILSRPWKLLVAPYEDSEWMADAMQYGSSAIALHHLDDDPKERRNLARYEPEIVDDLLRQLEQVLPRER